MVGRVLHFIYELERPSIYDVDYNVDEIPEYLTADKYYILY